MKVQGKNQQKKKVDNEEVQTVPMYFHEDKFFNETVIYNKETVYEVPEDKVDRWLKRGGVILLEGEKIPKGFKVSKKANEQVQEDPEHVETAKQVAPPQAPVNPEAQTTNPSVQGTQAPENKDKENKDADKK